MPAPDGSTPYDFVYDKAEVISDRGGTVDISAAILELSIFEHLWQSYQHGRMLLVDTADLFQSIQFRGTEKVEFIISFPNDENKGPYKKRFVITHIESHKKGNDNAAVILVNLVEEHFYQSKIKKVNRAYEGKPNEIITKLLRDNQIDKTLVKNRLKHSSIRYIVPWITPLKAADYVTEKATTERGLPYFLFSPIALEKKLVWKSLREILERPPIWQEEFIYSQVYTGKQDGEIGGGSGAIDINDPRNTPAQRSRAGRMIMEEKGLTIENYQHWDAYDLLSRIQSGTIGARYNIRNVNQFDFENYHFGYDEALSEIETFLPPNQKRFTYDNESYGGLHSNDAARFYISYLNLIYSDGTPNPFDLEMQDNSKRQAVARGLRDNMKMDNLDIQVPGYHFFPNSGDFNAVEDGRSIGRNLRMLFMNNDTEFDPEEPDKFIDKKLSGQYFVTSAHHHFDETKYTVSLTCCKYSELNE